MANVNRICEDILRKVVDSKLDFKVNQTPYSMYFSIRKKFIRNSNDSGATLVSDNQENSGQTELLRQELLYMRSEYEKLYNFYQIEIGTRTYTEDELETLKIVLSDKDNKIKQLDSEKKDLQGKYENRCLEMKQLKSEIETLKKEKNNLSVALKSSKQEVRDTIKAFEKKNEVNEKKMLELIEYRNKKLAEEREESLKKKKELKKARRKQENENKEKKISTIDEAEINGKNSNTVSTKASLAQVHENVETAKSEMEADSYGFQQEGNDENREDFKAKLMSEEEKEAFFASLVEDFKQNLDKINKPLLDNLEKMNIGPGD